MAILLDQARLYLQLHGHLPETFLLTELLGRSLEEAKQVQEWRMEEMLQYHPAVMAIRLVAERKRLRVALGLPPIEDEEATIFDNRTEIKTVRVNGVPTQVDEEALESVPAEFREMLKRKLMEQMEDSPGAIRMPDGSTIQFGSMTDFFDAIRRGDFTGQEGEEDGGESN